MKWFSMFSGIGGFDLALQRCGHEVVATCEIDKYARKIYSRHFPNVRIWEDATKIIPNELPEFDAICGGFPCQAFSIAGKRLGFEESRGTLFFEIARIAKERRPRILFLENVVGLLNHVRGRTFANILSTLDDIGYDAEWQVLNSKYFVPQNRERIFIIGYLRGERRSKIFPITRESYSDVRTQKKKRSEGKRIWSEDYTATLTTVSERGTSNILSFLNNKFRKLTVIEYERLQGFPDSYTEGLSDNQRYKCLGNAVTVPVIEFIVSRIK